MPTGSHRRGFQLFAVVFSLGLAIAGSTVLGQQPARKPAAATAPAKRPNGATAKPATKPAAKPNGAAVPAAAKRPAQRPYEKLAADETQKKKKSDISRILRAARFEGAEQTAFDTYYKTYFFPLWSNPENFASITVERGGKGEVRMREDLRKDLVNDFRTVKTGAVYTHLATMALEALSNLAKGHYHPVCRFNAMLTIGDLNVAEPARPTDPPVPLPAALPVLLDTLKDPKQIDVVKIAALRGLVRHSALGIADQEFRDTTLIPVMIQQATTRVTPGLTADGQAWMRMLAIEVLGNLHSVGPKGEVTQALTAVIGEPEGALLVRCSAARALGQLTYQPGAVPMNPQPMAAALNELLLQACSTATKSAENESPTVRRRECKEQVDCVKIALEKIQVLATTDAQRTSITNLLEQIQKIMGLLDNKDLEDATLVERLLPIVEQLGPAVAPAPAAAEAAAPAAKPAPVPAKQ